MPPPKSIGSSIGFFGLINWRLPDLCLTVSATLAYPNNCEITKFKDAIIRHPRRIHGIPKVHWVCHFLTANTIDSFACTRAKRCGGEWNGDKRAVVFRSSCGWAVVPKNRFATHFQSKSGKVGNGYGMTLCIGSCCKRKGNSSEHQNFHPIFHKKACL